VKTVPLGEVADFINGFAFKPEDWHDGGLPIIRIQNLTDPSKPINLTTRQVPEKYKVRRGDILVSWSATLGVFTWDRTDEALVNQHIFRVLPHESVIAHGYLKHILDGALVSMAQHLHGATMKHVNRGEFLATRIPLPPLDEQRRIAAILDQAASERERVTRRRDSVAGIRTALFHEMFGGYEPTDMLSDYCEVQGGLQVSTKRNALPVEVPYLRVANVYRDRLDLGEVKMLKATEAEAARTRLEPGDLLFVEGHANPNEVGRSAVWDGSIPGCVHQNHLIRARLDSEKLLPDFAVAWFKTAEGSAHFRRAGKTTSGLNTISASQVRSALLPIPPIEEQRLFADRCRDVRRLIQKCADAAMLTNDLCASLQSRAFSGKL
jgi:type I restriction enzyme S subunit